MVTLQGMLNFYFNYKRNLADHLLAKYRQRQLQSTAFSVICNNCIAGEGIYHKYQLKYSSPTVGLFFYPDDYIYFLENFYDCINKPLKFIPESKHKRARAKRYPIGVLNDEAEVQFIHYQSEYEANEKWNRRVKRIHFDNLFFMFSDRLSEKGEFNEEYFNRYIKLPFEHKVFFSCRHREPSETVIYLPDFKDAKQVGDMVLHREYEKYFDIAAWLNGKKDFIK